ncbi:MAG: ubiquinone/menaquinone biosynthesis methyltransferase [Leptospiraceae bacterium]|nr:ubiquinone/menaquinone biosynthesis methyltransferase [Leptospiraceae bacterium]MDW7976681.1 ubiquinone/menaquinone biosynthesis methyltransferase [Leptospiraceae bacterium]
MIKLKNLRDVLPKQDVKEKFVKENFNDIARYYDLFNDLFTFRLHRNWKKKLIKSLSLENVERAIDLCCGSGDIAIYMAKSPNIQRDFKVIACDFSEEMLKLLNQKIQKQNLNGKIAILNSNVLNLPKEFENSFDVATVGYGVRNVKDRVQFFREVYRILKDNGRFGILEVGDIQPKFLRPIAYFYMKYLIPLIGYFLQKEKVNMYAYLPASALEFPPPDVIKRELESVGFQNVTYKRVFFGASVIYTAYK